MRRLALLLVAGTMAAPASAAAQVPAQFIHTGFQWPDTTVQLADYHVVDQCLAATSRVKGDVEHRGWTNPWADTLPLDPHARLAPQAPPITRVARACLSGLARGAVTAKDYQLRLRLDLEAGHDSAAVTLVNAQLEAAHGKDAPVHDSIVAIALTEYQQAQPLRMALEERLIRQSPPRIKWRRLAAFVTIAGASMSTGDTARLRRYANDAMTLADSMEPSDYQTLAASFKMSVANARRLTLTMGGILANAILGTSRAALDTLRESTPAYARFMRAIWPKALGPAPPKYQVMGKPAPPLSADFWMPGAAGQHARPTPGRVSLVVLMHHGDCQHGESIGMIQTGDPSVPGRCFRIAAILHRLAARFPKLQITTIAPTQGQFVYDLTDSAKAEAAQFDRQMAAYHWPGTWGMVTRPFWRLPDPDDRRIDKSFA
ncbi:MAG: hypothetical protein ACYCVE_17015, partial [Gemmatimonadaceae bacterium]